MSYELVPRAPGVADYRRVRLAAGLQDRGIDAAELGLSNISGLLNQHLSQKSLPQSCSSKSVTSGSDCKHIYGLSEERLGCSGP